MQPKASVGDGFRVSMASTPSTLSRGSEQDDIESQGDVYTWGEVLTDGVSPDGIETQVPSKIDVLVPKLLESNFVLDIHQIASGVNHIAIVTKQGEVFTWGEESGGKLGHRIDKDLCRPQLVDFLGVPNLAFVACGEYHTCVVSHSCDFFTWGDGTHNVGLLGHGTDTSHWIPKRVDGPLDGLQVVSVACGTWHSALTTSDGKLFTFGDGAFGVLGHGDRKSVMYPKKVQLSSGLKAIKVACGVWHTAAIIEVKSQFGSNASPWKLFTWGDGNKYRLGHGNNETCLHPTKVFSLIEYNFHQVACGHTMTVALTTSGHVFTMGGTEYGQLGNPSSIGKVPTLVQDKLLGEFVEEISCGANHVAALTSKNELYTWGRGANGRLGHGDTEDKKSPTLVVALKDKHVKNISCGSNFSSCICIHKFVPGSEQSFCSNCRQAFGLTRLRYNCNNCGLVFCYNCSSKKALNAALASTPEKPHRVCDNCYAKLKAFQETSSASKFSRKATPPHGSTNEREVLGEGVVRSSRTLLSPITKPINYLEIRNSKPGSKYDSTSIIRASQVPSLQQLKDIEFPSSLSAKHYDLKPNIAPNAPPNLPANSGPTSPIIRRPSPLTRFSGGLVDTLRKTSEHLNQEVSKLQNQIQSLKLRSDMLEVENHKLQKKATEATAVAAVELSHLIIAKEFIESTKSQLKEMTEKFPQEIPGNKILRTIHTRAEDVLKEISESETSSLPSKLEPKQINAPDTLASNSDSSKLQEHKLEENLDIARVDPSQAEGNVLQENNGSKLESKQQNAPDLPTSHNAPSEQHEHKLHENVDAAQADPLQADRNFLNNGSKLESEHQNASNILASHNVSSKLHEHKLEENVDAAQVDPSQAEGNFLQESNGSKLESKQQNALDILASHSVSSNLHEPKLEEIVDTAQVDPLQDDRNFLQESNGSKLEYEQQNAPDIPASHCVPSKLHEHRLEENVVASQVDPLLQAIGNALQESKGKSISANGATVPPQSVDPQSVEYGSRSLDSSRSGRQGETQVIEQFEPGVFVTLMLQPDGIKVFKRVRFSKRKFTKNQAEEWWSQNKIRVLRQYHPSMQKLTIESSYISSPHVKEHTEASSSKT